MIILFYLAYIAAGVLIGRFIRQKSPTGAKVFVVVFCAWPIFEIFVLPEAVLRMNCGLAETKIYKTVTTDSFFTEGLSNREMVNMILDEEYREIQTYFSRKPDGSRSMRGHWFALHKVDAVSRACNLGRQILGQLVLRGGQCVGVTHIGSISTDYTQKYSRSFIKETLGFQIKYGGRSFINHKTGEVLAEQRNIYVRNLFWPVSRFAEEQFGIEPSGSCSSPNIHVSEVFLEENEQ